MPFFERTRENVEEFKNAGKSVKYAVQETTSMSWDRNPTSTIALELQLPADNKLPIMVALGINFEQAINRKMYSLNSGTYNAAAIVEVNAPAP